MASNIYTAEYATRIEMNSSITQTAQNINLSVDQKLTNYSTTTQMNSAIDIKANQITSSVSQTYATKTSLTTAVSQIIQTTNAISLQVSQKLDSSDFNQAEIIAAINDGVSSVKIRADNINLSGYLTISGASNTYASKSSLSSGTTTISGACITTGTIKGIIMQSTNYESGVSGTAINLNSGIIDSKNFKINSSGNVTLSNATLTGGTIKSANYQSGTAGMSINLANGSIDSNNFKVSSSGNVTITGTINATAGTIGGATIRNGVLTIENANIGSINGSKITGAGTLNGNTIAYESLVGNQLAVASINSDRIVSIAAEKISAGTIHGCDLSGGTLDYNVVKTKTLLQIGPTSTHMTPYADINVNGRNAIDYQLVVQHEGQYWRRLTFHRGLLVNVESEW